MAHEINLEDKFKSTIENQVQHLAKFNSRLISFSATASSDYSSPIYDGEYIYVLNVNNQRIEKYDSKTLKFLGYLTSALGSISDFSTFDGINIWTQVTSGGQKPLIKVNTKTKEVTIQNAPVETDGIDGIVFTGSHIFYSITGSVKKVNPETATVTDTYTIAGSTDFSSLIYDGTYVWFVEPIDDFLFGINPTTGVLQKSIGSLGSPDFCCDVGTHIWVHSSDTDNLLKINKSTSATDANIDFTPQVGKSLFFDGTDLWFAATSGGTSIIMSKIDNTLNTVTDTIVLPYAVVSSINLITFDGKYMYFAYPSRIAKISITTV